MGTSRFIPRSELNTYLDFVSSSSTRDSSHLHHFDGVEVDPNRSWILIIQFSIIVAVLADLAENVGILHALNNTNGAARLILLWRW
jgi:hypothetical protein